MKVCTACRRRLPHDAFYLRRRHGRMVLEAMCKDCKNKRRKDGRVEPSGYASRLDPAPFKAWLELKLAQYGSIDKVVLATGLPARRVTAVLHDEQAETSLTTVDKALTYEGSAFLFELYPHLYPGLDTSSLADVLNAARFSGIDPDRLFYTAGDEVLA